ncbi:glutathione S-transferase [Pseudaestuariivita atlantica]|uniref:Glutathione S-transferase n=1 Tax=Pseudaestuariivita atlantica TaxID=1317121 RepID=A0A0L1JTL9_9RHOB|nr:glutathione S-transferase [Pseudaestuariivita atlantica]KNG95027.1 glutathione S-transferase [Pseudaestuariivita atlantica]
MKLYQADASPFVRKVRVLLHETGQYDDVEHVPVQITPVSPDAAVSAANPLGKIPALERPDGPAIYDSRVICRYLDARKGAGLYPEARIWETLTLEATADGIMEAAVLMVYEARVRPEEKRFDGWIDAQWTKAIGAVNTINARWMSHLHGPLDAAHIAVACALGYLDFRHGDRDWRSANGPLAAWYAEFSARPSMQATVPG